ncbi:sigma-70 family RNA polymerase sigma factor [Sphingomicrobium marinum]|uniref:sigma-70 family RNA polymerase sigma factor n=1 Tax=Sphingomicrobium marinum TaxID=1227950 RepID=UPI00223F7FC7|nr:sigma-70 family RNA polymerase sigma factor [Sphingomicrobium marinum]
MAKKDSRSSKQARDELVAAIGFTASGDRAALKKVYDRTSAKLFGICLRICKEREIAEDVLQETYLKVWRRAGRYDAAKASPITWLSMIARNSAIDAVRRRRSTIGDEALAIERVADDAPLPDRLAEAGEIRERIEDCLEELDSEHQKCIRHAYFDGLSYSQVAERIGTPLGTIKGWMARSMKRLRKCLDDR